MERREREAIMRQAVPRPETPRDRAQRRALEADLRESELTGRPLPERPRNFRPDPQAKLLSLGGPLAWMRRLRDIESATDAHETALREEWFALAVEHADDEVAFAAAWRARAAVWAFDDVNDLIERHNRWFPVEARLAMDPRTGDYAHVNGKPYRREPLDADWILARFPPVLVLAA